MIIDIHTHGIFEHAGDFRSLNKILRLMKVNKVDLTGLTLNTGSPNLKKAIEFELERGFKKDPYKKHNLYLLNAISAKKLEEKIFPFLYLPPVKDLAKESMDFYESRFGERQFGYKIHNQEVNIDLEKMIGLRSRRPLIIHSSIDCCSAPDKMLRFAEEYKGNVDIAHFGKFSEKILRELRLKNNLFIDSSVGIVMFNALKTESARVHNYETLAKAKSLKRLYELVAKETSNAKILFATDYPFCDIMGKGYSYELDVLRNLKPELLDLVAYKNAQRFLQPR